MSKNKIIDYLQYTIAIGALLSILIWIKGGFDEAHMFNRSLTDWNSIWLPGLFDIGFLFAISILSILKFRIALLFTLLYFINDLGLHLLVVVYDGTISPDFFTILGEIIYILFLPLSLIGLAMVWIERSKKSIKAS